jgi:hypothetical protein
VTLRSLLLWRDVGLLGLLSLDKDDLEGLRGDLRRAPRADDLNREKSKRVPMSDSLV